MSFFSDLIGSATGGLIGSSPADKSRADMERIRAMILQASSPEELIRITNAIRPQFRELVAGGIGPSAQSSIETRLARSGASRTGIGTTVGNIGSTLPEIQALKLATQAAQGIQGNKIAALSNFSPLPYDDPIARIADLAGTIFSYKALAGGGRQGGGGGGIKSGSFTPPGIPTPKDWYKMMTSN